jgi:hypothetical protein
VPLLHFPFASIPCQESQKTVLYLEHKKRRRAHLGHAGPEGPAVGVDIRGILLHDAEVPKGLGVLRLAGGFHELRLVGGGLCLALHFHELRLCLGKEGLAHGQTLQEILGREVNNFHWKILRCKTGFFQQ